MNNIPSREIMETAEQHYIRVCIAKRNKEIDVDWVEIKEYFEKDITSDQIRKEAAGMAKADAAYNFTSDDIDEDDIEFLPRREKLLAKKELRIKQKEQVVNVQANALQKQIRETVRDEMIHKAIEKGIAKSKSPTPPKKLRINPNKKREYFITLADTHYGRDVVVRGFNNEILAEYNDKIFEQRMETLLNKLREEIKRFDIEHIHVINLSDSVDGILRVSQLQTLNKGIVDQVIDYANYTANWLNELSSDVTVDYYSLQGNHTEIRPLGSGSGDFAHENLEIIISKMIELHLKSNENIVVHESKPFAYLDLCGTKILATHGQNESRNLEQMVKDYIVMYNMPVNVLLTGHLHNTHNKTIGFAGNKNIEFIQAPSLCGIDDYSTKFKKGALPGSILVEFAEGEGKTLIRDITL